MRTRVKLRPGKVETICLEPGKNKNHVGKEATVAGWGALKYDYHKSAVLREVDVRVWNNTECGISYGSKAPGGIVHTMMCASKPEEGKDSCLVSHPLCALNHSKLVIFSTPSRVIVEVRCSTSTTKAATAARSASCPGECSAA